MTCPRNLTWFRLKCLRKFNDNSAISPPSHYINQFNRNLQFLPCDSTEVIKDCLIPTMSKRSYFTLMVSQFWFPQFPSQKHLLYLDCGHSEIMILTILILTKRKSKIYLLFNNVLSFDVINTTFQLLCTLFFISYVLR